MLELATLSRLQSSTFQQYRDIRFLHASSTVANAVLSLLRTQFRYYSQYFFTGSVHATVLRITAMNALWVSPGSSSVESRNILAYTVLNVEMHSKWASNLLLLQFSASSYYWRFAIPVPRYHKWVKQRSWSAWICFIVMVMIKGWDTLKHLYWSIIALESEILLFFQTNT